MPRSHRPALAANTALALLAPAAALLGPAPAAAADTPRCVTVREYRQVDVGMTKKQVHRIFDTTGTLGDGGGGGFTRTYRECDDPTPDCVIQVEYEVGTSGPPRVALKERNGACAG